MRMSPTPEKDLKHLKDFTLWSRPSVCPIKRYDGKDKDGFPTCAVVIDGHGPIVYEVNMFQLSEKSVNECLKHEYESFEAMIADGWMVD